MRPGFILLAEQVESLLKWLSGGGAEHHVDPDKVGERSAERLLGEVDSVLS